MNSPHVIGVMVKRQEGAATLLVSLILLIAVTLIVIVTSRSAVMEQRISANEVRAKSAFEAAQAGLEFGISYMNSSGGIDKNQDGVADQPTLNRIDLLADDGRVVGQYQVAFCDQLTQDNQLSCDAIYGCPAPTNLRQALVFSCGWSDDGTAVRTVLQTVIRGPAMPTPITNPMTSRGAINVSGAADVTNYYNNLTIWTGNTLTSIGATGKTAIRDPSIPVPADTVVAPSPPTNCNNPYPYVCTTDSSKTGPDVVQSDTSLSSLTTEQFFQNYFGVTPSEYRASHPTMDITPADMNTLNNATNEIIWVEGDATMPANMTVGTRENPVIMIVNGNFSAQANTVVNGIVFVIGNSSAEGNFTVNGGMAIDGTVSGNGTFRVIYDPLAAGTAASQLGQPGSLAGSWRDWLVPN